MMDAFMSIAPIVEGVVYEVFTISNHTRHRLDHLPVILVG